MKALFWVGSSKKDLMDFPKEVVQEVGYALHLAQHGELYAKAKPFKGFGSGVYEIAIEYKKNAFRSIYIVNIQDQIYVLHCFQKKSKRGIKTPKEEINKVGSRLRQLRMQLNSAKMELSKELENV